MEQDDIGVRTSERGSMKLWIAVGVLVVALAAAAAVYFFMPEKISYLQSEKPQAVVDANQTGSQASAPTVVEEAPVDTQPAEIDEAVEEPVSGEAGAPLDEAGEAEVAAPVAVAVSGERPERGLALIMDDTGYGLSSVEAALALGVPVTFSILPNAPDAAAAANQAYDAGQIVMVHMPMEPKDPDIADKMMGKIGLVAGMNEAQLRQQVDLALAKVPHASGMSNHMGSMLTEQADSMRWLMQDLKQRQMFFLDSLTTSASLGRVQAAKVGVAWASRRFFLDNDSSNAAMERMWRKILTRANKKGGCIVIFHASPSSLAFLKAHMQDVEGLVVPLNALLHPAAG